MNSTTDSRGQQPGAVSEPSDHDGEPGLDRPREQLGAVAEHRPRPDEPSGFQRLDIGWLRLTRLVGAITFVLVGVVVALVGLGLLSVLPPRGRVLVPIAWTVFLVCLGVAAFFWPRWQYDRWSYRLGGKVLELRFGVIWHVSVAIPLSRLQHIDLQRGPLERRLGLASLQIHTAGTRDACHTVPGLLLGRASELRDRLIEAANRGADDQVQE